MRRLAQIVLLAALAAPAVIALHSEDVYASVVYVAPYTFEQTFGTALRLLRVDLGCKITEKDAENGYLLFDYTSPESGKDPRHGSIEVVRSPDGTRVSVQIPSLPQYHEQMIVDALARKLLAEHGEPPPHPRSPPPDVDGGAAGDAGS